MSTTRSIEIKSSKKLTDQEIENIGCVSLALNGIRPDLDIEDIIHTVIELYNNGDNFGDIAVKITSMVVLGGNH